MSSPSTTRAAPSSQARDLSVALLSLYTELARLPYVPSESLVVPPPDGWPHINVSELRTRGKTGEVISLPQHLPFLSTRADGARWMVAPDAQAIDYSNGEVYSEILDEIQPTPAWCIWLTDPENRDGTGVLFDTKTGTITEFTPLGHKIMIDWEEYEEFPLENRWMAHPTWLVDGYFKLWKRRLERLIWMPVPQSQGTTAEWYITIANRDEEEDMLASDDEFLLDREDIEYSDESGDDGEEEEHIETKDSSNTAASDIPDEEVEKLMQDAYGQVAKQKRTELLSEEYHSEGSNRNTSSSDREVDTRSDRLRSLDKKTKEIYDIYTRNGWPSHFDRQSCKMELVASSSRKTLVER